MAFFTFRRTGETPFANSTTMARPAQSVDVLRRRAKHRLIGAVLLVGAGVVGFPLVFDTQPRTGTLDVQIDLPEKTKGASGGVATLPKPAAIGGPVSAAASLDPQEQLVTSNPLKAAPAVTRVVTPPTPNVAIPAAKPVNKPVPKLEPKTEAKAEPKPELRPEPKVQTKPEPKPSPSPSSDDGTRAKSLLEGKDSAPASSHVSTNTDTAPNATTPRFVIQVGAFADAAKAREARLTLERAGLKTYTHVAQTKDGERTRVRLGPFASKSEADKVATKVKTLSLPAAILTL